MSSLTPQSATAQYSLRPADECYRTLEDLQRAAYADAICSKVAEVPLGALQAVPFGEDVAIRGKSSGMTATMNHWAFSQLSRLAGAPGGYLRTLPPDLACLNLNHGIQQAADTKTALYLKKGGLGDLSLRAATTPVYSRYHDATFVQRLMNVRDSRPGLGLPPVWDKGEDGKHLRGGAYRGDRDCYVIMVDGGSIVDDPTISFGGTNGQMFRGIIGRNSEVGGAKLEILTFYFRGICGNHCIWGVQQAHNIARRHVGDVAAAFEQMIGAALQFFSTPASADVARIKALAAIELGADKPAVITAGREAGLSEDLATQSYETAERTEPNPRSVWGYAQGITRVSQLQDYQDDRLAMDLIAAKLLRRKVAA